MFILAIILASSIECAGCGDYKVENACLYYNKGTPLNCEYDGTQSWLACTTKVVDCSDFAANQTYCESAKSTLGIECGWDWDNTESKCQGSIVSDYCEYYNLSTATACTTNNGKFDCKFDEDTKSCTEKKCSDYNDLEDDCNAKASCKYDTTCKDVSCRNYSESASGCHDNDKGLLCKFDTATATCKPASLCSYFDENQTFCEANNNKLDCYWSATESSKCQDKAQCKYYTTKDSCYSNNGAMDCDWLASTSKCNTFLCESINNGLLDAEIASEAACLTSHPSECRWEEGKCTSEPASSDSGATAMSVSSLVILLLLLLTLFSS